MTTLIVAIGPWDIAPWRAEFAKAVKGRRIVFWPQDGQDDIAEPYVICSWKAGPAVYERFRKPLAVFSLGAGVDHLTMVRDKINAPVVRVINSDLTMRMVEYVAAGVLYLHRQLALHSRNQTQRRWEDITQPAACDVKVGIMGPGVLGGACGKLLQQIGYDVAAWARSPRPDSAFKVYTGRESLNDFLARTHILVNVLPNTPETKGLIGKDVFARLGKMPWLNASFFVNAGRGETAVEGELIEALQTGVLGGAVLDVFAKEPLPQDNPLWAMENVLITPHVAADSDPPAIVAQIMDNIARLERGEAIANPVDLARGY